LARYVAARKAKSERAKRPTTSGKRASQGSTKPLKDTPSEKRIAPDAMAPTRSPRMIGDATLAREKTSPQRFWRRSARES
jgi:hypothetical protein